MEPIDLPPVDIKLVAQWTSGQTVMNVTIGFSANTLDDALRLIKQATSMAPIFRDPDHPEED